MPRSEGPQQASKWPAEVYRRFSVDMHVPDWDPALLSRFDAKQYVGLMGRAGMQSLLQYTNSHVGLCLWRTRIGRPHAAMGDRDFFGDVVKECRRQGIHPLAYFSLIHDNWAFEHHPDWRIIRPDGSTPGGRYGLVCPNSPYREYVLACIREIAASYDIDGMFFDMTFWPGLCYCPHCAARFRKEVGGDLPRVVAWHSADWLAFQKARQRWLLEFAKTCTETAKDARPGITVNHQYSTIFHNWTLGVPLELAQACDYVGGDFYGGPTQHSLACKIYHGLTRTRPFEFHTSRTRNFPDHVTMKSMPELRTEAFVATLHSAALMLVDYINADGTLNPAVYEFLGRLSAERAVYEPFLGGDLLADVAIYFDKDSLYNPLEDGIEVTRIKAPDACPHRDAVVGCARALQEAHIPFGVVTNANLQDLVKYRAVMLPSVLAMKRDQAEVFREFVAGGGGLYASGPSSLDRWDKDGRFLLEDVLGARATGLRSEIVYITPEAPQLRRAIWPQDHLSHSGTTVLGEPLAQAEVLGKLTLPFVDPHLGTNIGSRFAAIHSNPPALSPEQNPSVLVHHYQKGKAVWVASSIEGPHGEKVNRDLVLAMLRLVLDGPCRFEADAHPAVEMTLFDQPEEKRLLAGLLNLQRDYPQCPVGATVRVLPPKGRQVTTVEQLPARKPVRFEQKGPCVQFRVEPFDVLALFLLNYD